jgi:4-hydroxybenzoate polyprenyltransferase
VTATAEKPKIKSYLSLVVFSHTIFAMPFAVLGYLLGVLTVHAEFSIKLFLLVIGCMVFARSAAMAFNRYIDREFDAKNQRTAVREIPSGIITPKSALAFVLISSALFILCTYFINSICFKLSPIALIVVLGYSYTKRFTPLCHLILGIGLSLAPIGAFLAVTGYFALQPLLFSFAVLFWVSGFDIIYALQDETFDRENSLYSIPSWLGKAAALNVSKIFHLISICFIFFAGRHLFYQPIYYSGFGIYVLLLIYQHSIVSPADLSRVNRAFGTTNGIASVIFVSFAVLALYWQQLIEIL